MLEDKHGAEAKDRPHKNKQLKNNVRQLKRNKLKYPKKQKGVVPRKKVRLELGEDEKTKLTDGRGVDMQMTFVDRRIGANSDPHQVSACKIAFNKGKWCKIDESEL